MLGKSALDLDEVSDEHAFRAKDALAIEPDIDDCCQALESEPDRLADSRRRELAAVPPIVGVEISRTIEIPSSGGSQGGGCRQRPVTVHPRRIEAVKIVWRRRQRGCERGELPTAADRLC